MLVAADAATAPARRRIRSRRSPAWRYADSPSRPATVPPAVVPVRAGFARDLPPAHFAVPTHWPAVVQLPRYAALTIAPVRGCADGKALRPPRPSRRPGRVRPPRGRPQRRQAAPNASALLARAALTHPGTRQQRPDLVAACSRPEAAGSDARASAPGREAPRRPGVPMAACGASVVAPAGGDPSPHSSVPGLDRVGRPLSSLAPCWAVACRQRTVHAKPPVRFRTPCWPCH